MPLPSTASKIYQEAGRISAEVDVSTSAAIKGNALLLAFYKASRHLSKLKSSLLQVSPARRGRR